MGDSAFATNPFLAILEPFEVDLFPVTSSSNTMNLRHGLSRRTAWLAIGLLSLAYGGCGRSDLQPFWQAMGGKAILNENGQVESLYLGQTAITDPELRKLHALPELKRLFLNDTAITDEGMQHLTKLDQLVHLDLDQTKISDAGIVLLLNLKKLRSINLLETNVTSVAINRFHEELPLCRVASLIEHSSNDINDSADHSTGPVSSETNDNAIEGSRMLIENVIAAQLKKPFGEIQQSELDAVRTLYLVNDDIVHLGKAADLVALQSLTVQSKSLRDLQGIEKLSQLCTLTVIAEKQLGDLEPLRRLEFLGDLSLQNCRIHDLGPLQGLVRLGSLDIRESEVVDLEPLRHLKTLQKLWLPGNRITDLNPLRELSQLKDLRITGNPIKSLAGIYELEALERLDIRGTQISEVEIETFKAARPACKVFHEGKSR